MTDVTRDWGQTGEEALGAMLRSDDFTRKPWRLKREGGVDG